MKQAPLTALPIFLISFASAVYAAPKDRYRPYAHPYPQIIQANDYPTIEAVEAVFSSLKKLGDDDVSCEVGDTAIICERRNNGHVVLDVPEKGPVTIAERPYSTVPAVVLFRTLKRILTDLSETNLRPIVRFAQFSTRAYARRTIVEFQFGQTIVVVDSFSNGPTNSERLYVLDIVDRNESFFSQR
jgi:hypothetical protein